jgi:hypothetical protein
LNDKAFVKHEHHHHHHAEEKEESKPATLDDEQDEIEREAAHSTHEEAKVEKKFDNLAADEDTSFGALLKTKQTLTKDIRKAGITSKDEAFMNSFSDAMTQNSTKKESLVQKESDDEDLDETLHHAKEMNSKIFQESHPKEYQAQQDKIKQQKQEEEDYKALVQDRMTGLKQEVNLNIEEFINKTNDIKRETHQKAKTLKKMKHKYHKLLKKRKKLEKKKLQKAEDMALVEATQQIEDQEKAA